MPRPARYELAEWLPKCVAVLMAVCLVVKLLMLKLLVIPQCGNTHRAAVNVNANQLE